MLVGRAPGTGPTLIERQIWDQLERDSDRSVGIVAASIIEQRLTEAFSVFLVDHKTLQGKAFDYRGPLGTFSSKIDMAFLCGLVTKEGHTNLAKVQAIRNKFAHKLEIDSFEHDEIRPKCFALTLLDKMLSELPPEEVAEIHRVADEYRLPKLERRPGVRMTGATDILINPRKRYIAWAEMFSSDLWLCSENARNGQNYWPAF